MIVNTRWYVNIWRKKSMLIVWKWLNSILNYQLQHCSKNKQHQNTLSILTAYEEDEVCNVLKVQVATTTIWALNILSTMQNEIEIFDQYKSPISYHNSILSGQQYTEKLLASPNATCIRECLHISLAVFKLICNYLWEILPD